MNALWTRVEVICKDHHSDNLFQPMSLHPNLYVILERSKDNIPDKILGDYMKV